MKKILVLVLALVMALSAVSALADITIVQNKVEIEAALQEYAAAYSAETGKNVKVITAGGSSDYNTALKAEFASGKEPDIFVIEGPTGYELYKDKIVDQTGAEWTQYTNAAYMDGDKVVGFPVAVEGYGMAYNADILAKDLEGNGHYESKETVGSKQDDQVTFDGASGYRADDLDTLEHIARELEIRDSGEPAFSGEDSAIESIGILDPGRG